MMTTCLLLIMLAATAVAFNYPNFGNDDVANRCCFCATGLDSQKTKIEVIAVGKVRATITPTRGTCPPNQKHF